MDFTPHWEASRQLKSRKVDLGQRARRGNGRVEIDPVISQNEPAREQLSFARQCEMLLQDAVAGQVELGAPHFRAIAKNCKFASSCCSEKANFLIVFTRADG